MTIAGDLQPLAAAWLEFMVDGLVGGFCAFAVVLVLWLAVRRWAPAQLGCGLFLLVLVKLVVPIEVPAPAWLFPLSPGFLLDQAPELAAAPAPVVGFVAFVEADAGTPAVPAAVPPLGPSPVAAAATPTPWESWLFLAWLAIATLLFARFVLAQVRTTALVKGGRPLERGELPVDLDDLCRRARVRGRVRFVVVDDIDSPAAGGLLSPYVLIPAGLAPRLGARPLSFVLLHELAHVRRGDVFVALAQKLVQTAFFFHPAVWLANWIIDEQREFACDDEALAASGAPRKACGEGFLSIVEWSRTRQPVPVATLGMFDSKTAIRRRLMRILNKRRRPVRAGSAATTLFVLTVGAALVPTAEATATETTAVEVVAQDPGDLERLQAELNRLKKEYAALRKKLEELSGDEDDPAEVNRYTELDSKRSIYVVGEDGEPVEIEVAPTGGWRARTGKGEGKAGTYRWYSTGKDGRTLIYSGRGEGEAGPGFSISTADEDQDPGEPTVRWYRAGKPVGEATVVESEPGKGARTYVVSKSGEPIELRAEAITVAPRKGFRAYVVDREGQPVEVRGLPGEVRVVEIGKSKSQRGYVIIDGEKVTYELVRPDEGEAKVEIRVDKKTEKGAKKNKKAKRRIHM